MPFGLPDFGETNWHTELNDSINTVKATADAATASAATAVSTANSASNAATSASANASTALSTANTANTNASTALAASNDTGLANTISTGTVAKAVIQALIDAKASAAIFRPRNYGAAENGTTDDSTALANCITAADAVDGIVELDGTYRLTTALTIPPSVSLRGSVSKLTGLTRSTIKLDSSTACLKFEGATPRGGYHTGFNVNGNNTGATDGAVQVTTTQQAFDHITITDAAGVGLLVDGAQNTVFRGVDVNSCGGDNLVIDGGSGGLLFTRCEISSATGWDVRLTESNPGGHPSYGYQYGPADIEFHKCLIENYESGGTGLLLAEAGTRITFRMCGFSVNNVTMTGGYVVKINNDKFPTSIATQVEFNSCNLNGGAGQNYPIFYVQGTNTLTTNRLICTGAMFYQQSTAIYHTDGPTIGVLNCDEVTSGVTARFSAAGAGSFSSWLLSRYTGLSIKTEDPTGAWANGHPLIVGRSTDAGARIWVDRDGTVNWGNGSGFSSLASIGRNSNGTVLVTGQTLVGRSVVNQTDFAIPSSGYALTTDVSTGGPIYGYSLAGTNGIASWTLSNPVNLQQITLKVTRVASQTVTWPTNVRFANNTAPTLTGNTETSVMFQYRIATGLWYELYRAADVPTS